MRKLSGRDADRAFFRLFISASYRPVSCSTATHHSPRINSPLQVVISCRKMLGRFRIATQAASPTRPSTFRKKLRKKDISFSRAVRSRETEPMGFASATSKNVATNVAAIHQETFRGQIAFILRIQCSRERAAPRDRRISTGQHIFSRAPPPFRWLQIPLFGRCNERQGRPRRDRKRPHCPEAGAPIGGCASSGRQPTQTLIWFPK